METNIKLINTTCVEHLSESSKINQKIVAAWFRTMVEEDQFRIGLDWKNLWKLKIEFDFVSLSYSSIDLFRTYKLNATVGLSATFKFNLIQHSTLFIVFF